MKAKSRERVFRLVPTPAKNVLLLPSDKCEDIKFGFASGKFNADTKITGVEYDYEVFLKMKQSLAQSGLPTKNITFVHGKIEDYIPTEPIDFAFIDLMGNLTAPIARWILTTLSPNLANNATFAFSASCWRAPSPWLVDHYDSFAKQPESSHWISRYTNPVATKVRRWLYNKDETVKNATTHAAEATGTFLPALLSKYSNIMEPGYTHLCYAYRDTRVNMVTFAYTRLHKRKKTNVEVIDGVLDHLFDKQVPKTNEDDLLYVTTQENKALVKVKKAKGGEIDMAKQISSAVRKLIQKAVKVCRQQIGTDDVATVKAILKEAAKASPQQIGATKAWMDNPDTLIRVK